MKHAIVTAILTFNVNLAILLGQSPIHPNINEVAQRYGEHTQEVVKDYNRLLSGDSAAIQALSSQGAYPVLALALPETKSDTRNTIAYLLQQATAKDALIIDSVSSELSKENTVAIEHGGELVAAHYMIKRWFVNILAKQTNLDATEIDVDDTKQVSAFIIKVRASK